VTQVAVIIWDLWLLGRGCYHSPHLQHDCLAHWVQLQLPQEHQWCARGQCKLYHLKKQTNKQAKGKINDKVIINHMSNVICHMSNITDQPLSPILPKTVNLSHLISFSFPFVPSSTSRGFFSVVRKPVLGDTEIRGHAGAVVAWSMNRIQL